MSARPITKFVRSGQVDIAYQTHGDGDLDVVLVPNWISHCEVAWELAEFARFLERLAECGRLVVFDKRGMGMSDRLMRTPTLEEHVDDLRSVLDALGSNRVSIVGWGDGAAVALVFAAAYPERVNALVLGGVVATVLGDPTSAPGGLDPALIEDWAGAIESHWGEGLSLPVLAPSVANDARFVGWWRRLERCSMTPNAASMFFRFIMEVDVQPILHTIQAPTLVLHKRNTPFPSIEAVQWFAGQIPGARFVVVPGTDALPYTGDADAVLDEIEEFLTGARGGSTTGRVLATVLFVDIVASTQHAEAQGDRRWTDLLEAFRREVRQLLDRSRGREIDTAGDGLLATFDGPARAIRCALAIREAVADLGLEIRGGLHTGEVELAGDSVSGVAVHIAARVVGAAAPGQILVTGTVKDLVIGSGLHFKDQGMHQLKGVTGDWHLFQPNTDRP